MQMILHVPNLSLEIKTVTLVLEYSWCRIYTFARMTSVPITYLPHHLLHHSPRHSQCSLWKQFFEHESKGTNGDSHYVYEHVNVRASGEARHEYKCVNAVWEIIWMLIINSYSRLSKWDASQFDTCRSKTFPHPHLQYLLHYSALYLLQCLHFFPKICVNDNGTVISIYNHMYTVDI